jgi:hypothetical protein
MWMMPFSCQLWDRSAAAKIALTSSAVVSWMARSSMVECLADIPDDVVDFELVEVFVDRGNELGFGIRNEREIGLSRAGLALFEGEHIVGLANGFRGHD